MRVCGPRYCGPGWSNRSAGFRRRAPVCPPPHLHKCEAALRRLAERCGKTVVPSWNSRGAGRDGHRDLHSKVYLNCDVHANSIPNWMEFRYVIGTAAPNLLPVPDPRDRGRCWTRNLPNTLGSRGGAGRAGVRDGRELGLKSAASGPLGLCRRYRCREPSPCARPGLHQRD